MAILTTETCKAFLNITDSTYDTWIAAMIPAIQNEVEELCNNTFLDSEGDEAFPASISFAAAQMIGYRMNTVQGVESHGMEGISTTFRGQYPDDIMRILNVNTLGSFL